MTLRVYCVEGHDACKTEGRHEDEESSRHELPHRMMN
jgi:hypothetical protein